jgi:hypothetical protein
MPSIAAQMALGLAAPPRTSPREVLGGALGARVSSLFECIEAAEEEIAAADLPADLRSRAFGALCPTLPLHGKSLDLYRAHARELLGRMHHGDPLEPGTLAECLSVCMYAAGAAPLRQEGQALAEWLYAQVFPEHAKAIGAGDARERWEGQVQEDLAVLRRKLAVRRAASDEGEG